MVNQFKPMKHAPSSDNDSNLSNIEKDKLKIKQSNTMNNKK